MIKKLGFDKYSALYLWAAFMLVFGLWKHDTFLTHTTFKLVLQENVIVGVLGLAFLIPLVTGTYDLSIGTMMTLSLVTSATLTKENHWHPIAALAVSLLLCMAVGFVSGFVVVKLRVNSFIATLGMSQIITAVVLKVHDQSISTAYPQNYMDLGAKELFGVQRYVWYLLVVALIVWFVFEHTPVGRFMFATGGNPEAARLAGVRTNRLVWGSLVASALLAGFAGTVYSWKIGNYAQSVGPGYLFQAIAAVFFGASQLKGRPNVWGTMIALYSLAFGIWGLHLVSPTAKWIDPLFQGVTLLIAVSLASRSGIIKIRKRRSGTTDTVPMADVPPEAPLPAGAPTDAAPVS